MNGEKLSIEDFKMLTQKLKEKMQEMILEYEKFEENTTKLEKDITEEEFIKKLNELLLPQTTQLIQLQNELLTYDLSNIPSEMWKGITLISGKNLEIGLNEPIFLDFSKTNANIDLKILDITDKNFVNLASCNIKKFDNTEGFPESAFDEKTKLENKINFLSNNFSKEFKEKFYKNKLDIDDIISLNNDQLEEISQKNPTFHLLSMSQYIYSEYKHLDDELLEKINELLKYSLNDYYAVIQVMSKHYSNDLSNKLKNAKVEEYKKVCFDYVYEEIIQDNDYEFHQISEKKFLPIFVEEYPNLFLKDINIPEEVKSRYFERKLKIEDLITYSEVFSNIPIDNFMDEELKYTIEFLKDNFGLGTFQKLVKEHPKVFLKINEETADYRFRNIINEEKNFVDAVKKYLIDYHKSELSEEQIDGKTTIIVPDWVSSMNFKVIDSIHNVKDLLEYDTSTILLDYEQINVIKILGIENIKKFEKETGFFSYKENDYDGDFSNLRNFVSIFNKDKMVMDGFKKGSLSYDEFRKQFAFCLDQMRQENIFLSSFQNYDFLEGKFREEYSNIFIDQNAPDELKQEFYRANISVQTLIKCKNYLINKNIAKSIKKINLISKTDNDYLSNDTKKNFAYEYISRYGNEKFFELVEKYGLLLENITIEQNDEKEIESEAKIERNLREAVYQKLIKSDIDYSILLNNLEFIEEHQELFLPSSCDEELKNMVYERKIDTKYIKEHPEYEKYFRKLDANVLLQISAKVKNKISPLMKEEAYNYILDYGEYLEKINKTKLYIEGENKEEFIDSTINCIYKEICKKGMNYDDLMPIKFKEKHPELFLPNNCDEELKDKFYNKKIDIEYIEKHPNILEYFNESKVSIVYGLDNRFQWLIDISNKYENIEKSNELMVEFLRSYDQVEETELRQIFRSYVEENYENIEKEKIKYISEILNRINLSNSIEIRNLKGSLATQVLNTENPIDNLEKVEKIFIKNNLPTVGKIYSCFEILHPEFKGFSFDGPVSPVLKSKSTRGKEVIVFSDLIKASFGSNNRSVKEYLDNIEMSNNLYEDIINGNKNIDSLTEKEKNELFMFTRHLQTLNNNTLKGKLNNDKTKIDESNMIETITKLKEKLSPNGSLDYNLGDRVISMFCHFAGIDTLEEAKTMIYGKVKQADERNRIASLKDMTLEKGDFIKGIGNLTYLGNILQNGSVSKEYLGASATSDATPLDTDISMILDDEGTISEKMAQTAATAYGPIFFVLKGDNRFEFTRTLEKSDDTSDYSSSKMEVFYTGVLGNDHYGIRTGFASSDINYIICDPYDNRIGLEIALNGFYIPVADKQGKIVFTPNDYDKLREKMAGLSQYSEENYRLSNNIVTPEITKISEELKNSEQDSSIKRNVIVNAVKRAMGRIDEYGEKGLEVREEISKDLDEGYVEFIDTGSTGRGTNIPYDADFDFMMKVDQKIKTNPKLLEKLKQEIIKEFTSIEKMETVDGNFRYKGVQIEGLDKKVDIDITFEVKTDKVQYSTDMCVKDRLNSIKEQYPDKYDIVIANIIKAKQILKEGECYKPTPQGGLGGIGVENWILQNGGSLEDAIKSFLKVSETSKNYEEFNEKYKIYNYGENHMSEAKGRYPHNEFVQDNMSADGYDKMKQTLKKYLLELEQSKDIEKQAEMIINQMAQGIDVLGESQEQTINQGRRMGFTITWLIGILTGIVSLGMVILGVLVTK